MGVLFFAVVAVIAAASQFGSFPSIAFLVGTTDTRKISTSNPQLQPRKSKVHESGNDLKNNELPSFITDLLNKKKERAYVFDPSDDDYDESDLTKLNIRKWGCKRRNEAPFIFVHIGKPSTMDWTGLV